MRSAAQPRPVARPAGRVTRIAVLGLVGLVAGAGAIASAEELPRGAVIGDVACEDAPAQHYALYLPSNYTPDRQWPVILLFDAAARGREGVERYRAAAERYGYIVAGSNNSRNGPWEPSLEAAAAMNRDVTKRFPVDGRRVYTAGMSGGARVAIMIAQRSQSVAGVLASSAAYAETFHESVRFPLFGSVGTEDFNYREMHIMDLRMKSPHRVEVFEGGHTWLPSDVATDGVEWMEVQAMKAGLRPRDAGLIDTLFAKRVARADAQRAALARMRALKLISADFDGLRDVTAVADSVAALERQAEIADAIRAEREADEHEWEVTAEGNKLLRQLGWPEREAVAFQAMRAHVTGLQQVAGAAEDSPDRRIARRALAGLRAAARGVPHAGFKVLMQNLDLPAPAAARPR